MSTLNYYRRYQQDGSCMVICTRCFLTVGIAYGHAAARELEAAHVCSRAGKEGRLQSAGAPPTAAAHRAGFVSGSFRFVEAVANWNPLVLAAALALALYALPTALEYFAAQHMNPWLAVILPGDAVGCAALIVLFNKRRTGLILYLLLTGLKSVLYLSRAVTPIALVWIVDLIPTLVAMSIVPLRRLVPRAPRAVIS